ncbi:MAG: hypothetical protein ACKO23_16410 [Gemmataceae bacterium]
MPRRVPGLAILLLPLLALGEGCSFPRKAEGVSRSGKEYEIAPPVNQEIASQPINFKPPDPPPFPSDYHPRDPSLQIPTKSPSVEAAEPKIQATAQKKSTTTEAVLLPAEARHPVEPVAKDPPLVAALRCTLQNQPKEAQQILQKHSKDNSEVLSALMRLTAGLGEGDWNKIPPDEARQIIETLSQVEQSLRHQAPLLLERACFCKRIDGFGQFQTFEPNHAFRPGWEGSPGERVRVYAQVRNFESTPLDGLFETKLECHLEIMNAERKTIATIDLPPIIDRSKTPRQDFFLNLQWNVPSSLKPGLHTLWIKIRDLSANPPRESRCSLDFRVGPPTGTSSAP